MLEAKTAYYLAKLSTGWDVRDRSGAVTRSVSVMIAAVFLAFALVSYPLGAAETKPPPTVDELIEYFDTIVFKSEFDSVAPSTVVKKWTGPLRVGIRAFEETVIEMDGREVRQLKRIKVKKPHIKFIKKHLKNLVRATGLKTEDAKKTGLPPNLMIYFVPRQQMANPYLSNVEPKLLKKLASEGGCYFLVWADNKTGKISKATIVVNSERLLIRINHCLLEEMTQSLGLPNDSNQINPSIFSDRSRRTDLTRTDLIILKALYDPRMKAGLPRDKALVLARTVIGELNATLP